MKIGREKFKASDGWIKKWKKRFRITYRAITKVGRKLKQTEEDMVRITLHCVLISFYRNDVNINPLSSCKAEVFCCLVGRRRVVLTPNRRDDWRQQRSTFSNL